MMTLAAGRFTPADRVLVATRTRSAPLAKASSTTTLSSEARSAGHVAPHQANVAQGGQDSCLAYNVTADISVYKPRRM